MSNSKEAILKHLEGAVAQVRGLLDSETLATVDPRAQACGECSERAARAEASVAHLRRALDEANERIETLLPQATKWTTYADEAMRLKAENQALRSSEPTLVDRVAAALLNVPYEDFEHMGQRELYRRYARTALGPVLARLERLTSDLEQQGVTAKAD